MIRDWKAKDINLERLNLPRSHELEMSESFFFLFSLSTVASSRRRAQHAHQDVKRKSENATNWIFA